MNIFKMYTHYAICFMIFVGGSSSHMFCSSSEISCPEVTRDLCTYIIIGGCAYFVVAGTLYATGVGFGVIDPGPAAQIYACKNAHQVQQWKPELTLLHKYDYNTMFVPHSAQGNPSDRGETECSASLARILDPKKLSSILSRLAKPQCPAAPEDQSMDGGEQAHDCSLLDQLEKQNQHSQQDALGIFTRSLPGKSPSWHLNSFNNNAQLINNLRAQFGCANMTEDNVKRLASARACLQLKSSKKQAQEEYNASASIVKPTQEDLLSAKVRKTHVEKIDEAMKREKCD